MKLSENIATTSDTQTYFSSEIATQTYFNHLFLLHPVNEVWATIRTCRSFDTPVSLSPAPPPADTLGDDRAPTVVPHVALALSLP